MVDVDSGGSPKSNFPQLLARHRKAAGLTQEELAARSGISSRAISDMERGRVRRPQHRTLQALAAVFAPDEQAMRELLRAGRDRDGPAAQDPGQADNSTPKRRFERLLRELPPEVADLTGREAELNRMLGLIDDRTDTHRTATVITVFGPPGVGKTSFVVHAGHRLVERYPDGCFFLDLHGMDSDRLTGGQALGTLLLALGVAEEQLPHREEERASLYRSLLRDQKILLVLDNIADEAQVRPLLPSSPGCLVLLTSRRALSGLESVHRVLLDVLRPAESVRLLASIIDPRRVAAEAEAAARVAELCGHLPLALRIAGNRLASRPRWKIDKLVRQLSDQQRRLNALTAGDLQVRSAFEVSYRQCDERTRSVFRRLSLAAGPDVTVELTAVLVDIDLTTAEQRLEELVDASLLDTAVLEGRYVLHDLMRLFARERLAVEESPEQIRDAEDRMAGWLLRTGTRAGRLLSPAESTVDTAAPPTSGTTTGPADAVLWLDAEQPNWLAALRHAAANGRHAEVLSFSRAMHWYSDLRPTETHWREVFTLGVEAARSLGSRRDEAVQLNFLGWALNRIHRLHQDALVTHQRAWQAARDAGDRNEEAWALQYCGRTQLDQGRAAEAAEVFRSAITLFHQLADPLGQHITLSFLGLALHDLDRHDEATVAQRKAVHHFRQAGTTSHAPLLALCLLRLAGTLEAMGNRTEADATYTEARTIAAEANSPFIEGLASFGSGRCRHELADITEARQQLGIALTIFTGLTERWLQARVLHRLASVLEGPDAHQARQRTLDICLQLDTPQARDLAASLAGESGLPTKRLA
ncbi:ATP-binding protein [Actinophytocola sp.]|uniref:ATP-binding protein n=1 Tax=Actinophytocola sp. TaxID=1872138 RepID=UPI002ED50E98